MRRTLVIGYGNPGRQDDGLGPAAAAAIARLGRPEVTARDDYQLVPEDAIDIADHESVWFVDAARAGTAPYAVRRLEPAFDIAFTSHLLAPETLLAIVAQQFGRRPEAHLLGIRGYAFGFEEGLTRPAAGNLAAAMTLLRRRLGEDGEAAP